MKKKSIVIINLLMLLFVLLSVTQNNVYAEVKEAWTPVLAEDFESSDDISLYENYYIPNGGYNNVGSVTTNPAEVLFGSSSLKLQTESTADAWTGEILSTTSDLNLTGNNAYKLELKVKTTGIDQLMIDVRTSYNSNSRPDLVYDFGLFINESDNTVSRRIGWFAPLDQEAALERYSMDEFGVITLSFVFLGQGDKNPNIILSSHANQENASVIIDDIRIYEGPRVYEQFENAGNIWQVSPFWANVGYISTTPGFIIDGASSGMFEFADSSAEYSAHLGGTNAAFSTIPGLVHKLSFDILGKSNADKFEISKNGDGWQNLVIDLANGTGSGSFSNITVTDETTHYHVEAEFLGATNDAFAFYANATLNEASFIILDNFFVTVADTTPHITKITNDNFVNGLSTEGISFFTDLLSTEVTRISYDGTDLVESVDYVCNDYSIDLTTTLLNKLPLGRQWLRLYSGTDYVDFYVDIAFVDFGSSYDNAYQSSEAFTKTDDDLKLVKSNYNNYGSHEKLFYTGTTQYINFSVQSNLYLDATEVVTTDSSYGYLFYNDSNNYLEITISPEQNKILVNKMVGGTLDTGIELYTFTEGFDFNSEVNFEVEKIGSVFSVLLDNLSVVEYTVNEFESLAFQTGLMGVKVKNVYFNNFLNQEVIPDIDGPVISLTGQSTSFTTGDATPDFKTYITANDAVEGVITITDEMIDLGTLDMSKPGLYPIKFTVSDQESNASVAIINIVVKAPVSNVWGDSYNGLEISNRMFEVTDSGVNIVSTLNGAFNNNEVVYYNGISPIYQLRLTANVSIENEIILTEDMLFGFEFYHSQTMNLSFLVNPSTKQLVEYKNVNGVETTSSVYSFNETVDFTVNHEFTFERIDESIAVYFDDVLIYTLIDETLATYSLQTAVSSVKMAGVKYTDYLVEDLEPVLNGNKYAKYNNDDLSFDLDTKGLSIENISIHYLNSYADIQVIILTELDYEINDNIITIKKEFLELYKDKNFFVEFETSSGSDFAYVKMYETKFSSFKPVINIDFEDETDFLNNQALYTDFSAFITTDSEYVISGNKSLIIGTTVAPNTFTPVLLTTELDNIDLTGNNSYLISMKMDVSDFKNIMFEYRQGWDTNQNPDLLYELTLILDHQTSTVTRNYGGWIDPVTLNQATEYYSLEDGILTVSFIVLGSDLPSVIEIKGQTNDAQNAKLVIDDLEIQEVSRMMIDFENINGNFWDETAIWFNSAVITKDLQDVIGGTTSIKSIYTDNDELGTAVLGGFDMFNIPTLPQNRLFLEFDFKSIDTNKFIITARNADDYKELIIDLVNDTFTSSFENVELTYHGDFLHVYLELPTNDDNYEFVFYADGPLGEEVEIVFDNFEFSYPDNTTHIVRMGSQDYDKYQTVSKEYSTDLLVSEVLSIKYNDVILVKDVDYILDDYLLVLNDSFLKTLSLGENTINVLSVNGQKDIVIYVADSRPLVSGENTYDKSFEQNHDLNIDLKGEELVSIFNGGYQLSLNDDFVIVDNVLTLSGSYLKTLEVGNHTFVLSTSKGEASIQISVVSEYDILPVTEFEFDQNAKEDIVITTNIPLDLFTKLIIGEQEIDSSKYIVIDNQLTLPVSLLETLEVGSNSIKLVASDALFTFTVDVIEFELTCPIGEEVDGEECKPITCPIGEHLEGSDCVLDEEETQGLGTGVIVAIVTGAVGLLAGAVVLVTKKFK